ncbi:hypothetical protein PCASD_15443 [Puccinia coronata f. sp. avenae]|uniref:Uncharacterized protein n=1 Tax=Puccinia coronata f. sp. avenae TaxID=200324 RepID=A0A2N5UPV4_9BASI|nr:hypothetical protein PCASD_15443 [Puccinia coronata f. sp. avenae]
MAVKMRTCLLALISMGVQTSLAMEPIINNFPAEASLSDVNLPLECDKIVEDVHHITGKNT